MCVDGSSPLLPSKRKLDDLSSRASTPPRNHPPIADPLPPPPHMIQFFVRIGSCSRVFHARPDDTVEDLHDRIRGVTGIPASEQRLIYAGRQLHPDLTLAQYGVGNDSCLQLIGKLRSMQFPRAWTLANELISWVSSARDGQTPLGRPDPATLVRVFLAMASKCADGTAGHFQVFLLSGAPAALVMLYLSQPGDSRYLYRIYAERCILLFVQPDSECFPRNIEPHCTQVLFEFCRLFHGRASRDDKLYAACRRKLGVLLEPSGVLNDGGYFGHPRSGKVIKELLPFALEVGGMLHERLLTCLAEKLSPNQMRSLCDVLLEFSNFIFPLRRAIMSSLGGEGRECEGAENVEEECWFLPIRRVFLDMLDVVNRCLKMVEDEFLIKGGGELSECQSLSWSFFLILLTELNGISEIFKGEEKLLYVVMLERRVPLNALLSRAKHNISFRWFLQVEDVTNFEARRNLALMLFPQEKEDYGELHEMLIDRSNLLAESFEYITNADPLSLQNHIFMEFKNEDATGPGVLREWFYLLSRAIFNPQNVLFSPCPNDWRRFFPNPTSAVDPLHLKYFGFCGRIIALALRHKVHIGVVFDRVFFQQLAGKRLSLEDIQDADPVFYTSCNRILEMDAEIVDSDALGLTFARETEELGVRRLVELCPGGEQIVVNSTNRQKYVDLLIHHRFVASISQQVAHFSQGFADIISSSHYQQFFFQSLKLEDFDRMLGGREGGICVKDWKRHTEYKGYRMKDRQIKWFWKVVEEMPVERHGVLMTFWTSLRHLPSEGFGGLPSKLYIHRSSSSGDSLPTSHTCFYQLCLPAYHSVKIMRERLLLITQEHVGSSFGRW